MWAIYAFLSAFFIASTDPITKKILNDKDGDEYLVGWLMLLLSTPFLGIFYFSHNGVVFSWALLKTLAMIVPIEIIATILYYKALRLTDISLSVPFLALTPIFLIVTGFLLLGERISPQGMAGIGLIAFGVYSINIKEMQHGILQPIRSVFRNKGSLYMILVAMLYSITSAVSKRALLQSSPQAIPFIYNSFLSLAMAPIIFYRVKNKTTSLAGIKRRALLFGLLGLFSAISSIFYFSSVALANVAYSISIKRLSLLMSVGYGWLFFRERDVHIRILATLCMFTGIVIIMFAK